MGQALYRKHRPKKLEDVVGQDHVTTTLQHAIKSGRIAHAYLFTGPRGVGKTSIARILAHELNGLPYEDESFHMDIIEIDAASNRRIDEIRDLREKVHIAPTSSKYKVYIIDEVHMLTKEAFNALLKTLEEPPAHVIFILATTEAHKLPETIISRTQRFSFKPVDPQKVIDHLKAIAKAEKITITDDALTLIAEHGEGSFRDSISLLDQASNRGDRVELSDIQHMLGIAPSAVIDTIIQTLASGNTADLIHILETLPENGYQTVVVAKQLSQRLTQDIRTGASILPLEHTLRLMHNLLEIPSSSDPQVLFMLLLVGAQLALHPKDTLNPPPQAHPDIPSPVSQVTGESPRHTQASDDTPKKTAQKTSPGAMTVSLSEMQPEPKKKATPLSDTFNQRNWERILQRIKSANHALYTAVRMSQPELTGTRELTLYFKFKLHQKKVDESHNKKIVADCTSEVLGGNWRILSEIRSLDSQDAPIPSDVPKPAEPSQPAAVRVSQPPEAVLDIFGGGEVL